MQDRYLRPDAIRIAFYPEVKINDKAVIEGVKRVIAKFFNGVSVDWIGTGLGPLAMDVIVDPESLHGDISEFGKMLDRPQMKVFAWKFGKGIEAVRQRRSLKKGVAYLSGILAVLWIMARG